jgi:hypothetical protein
LLGIPVTRWSRATRGHDHRALPDPNTALVLRAHLARQDEAKARLGDDGVDHDLLFTEPDGSPLHPADVADEFARLIKLAGAIPRKVLHPDCALGLPNDHKGQ